MGKGRDKRKRAAKRNHIHDLNVAPPPNDPQSAGDPDALIPVPIKPKPHLRSGAIALPEPDALEEEVVAIFRKAR
jgi:hypothetical protein